MAERYIISFYSSLVFEGLWQCSKVIWEHTSRGQMFAADKKAQISIKTGNKLVSDLKCHTLSKLLSRKETKLEI